MYLLIERGTCPKSKTSVLSGSGFWTSVVVRVDVKCARGRFLGTHLLNDAALVAGPYTGPEEALKRKEYGRDDHQSGDRMRRQEMLPLRGLLSERRDQAFTINLYAKDGATMVR
jgi:hypothetical protein